MKLTYFMKMGERFQVILN